MSKLHWLWHELTRPRGSVSHRFYRVGRGSRSGVALLIVITSVMFLTIIGAEITGTATVRMRLAANQRDEAMAEALAYTGLGFYRLILVTANGLDGKIGSQSGEVQTMLKQFGVSGDMLWQMVPFINTNLLRMIFVSGGDLDDDEKAELEEKGLTDEEREESREGSSSNSKPGFMDFEGDFFAEVTDETRRINVREIRGANVQDLQNHPAAIQLIGLMTGTQTCAAIRGGHQASYEDTEDNTQFFRDRDLEPLELVGNLADWVDKDSTRAYMGGDENSLYDRLEDPYKTKNAPFDSLEEVRLVDGWHRDDVWERYGEQITVYGEHAKVNVNSAECEVLWALLKSYTSPPPADFTVDQCIRAIENYRQVVPFSNEDAFVNFLGGEVQIPQDPTGGAPREGSCELKATPQLKQNITTKTKVFRVTSVGEVGESKVSIEAVFDFSDKRNVEGKILYWRID
ncbi:MAG: type II secretory pathway component PulK [Kiritimatiellia bacterium]|jgi:type II secretory pathway component PulK